MYPGPSIYGKCPTCQITIQRSSLASGNTFGAIYWTDGKMDAEMLPEYSAIVKCPDCRNLFWIEDAIVIGEYDWFRGEDFEAPEEWKNAKSLIDPQIDDYISAIEAKTFSDDSNREKYMRIRLWWLINDFVRYEDKQPDLFKKHRELFLNNLMHLDKLLGDNHDYEKLMKAEISRELGHFDLCVDRLKGVSTASKDEGIQIYQFAQRKSQIVQCLKISQD
ncbi:MAG: hypothetical protein WC156_15505 [Pedobacter sp.]